MSEVSPSTGRVSTTLRPCAMEGTWNDGVWGLVGEKKPPHGGQEGPLAGKNESGGSKGKR